MQKYTAGGGALRPFLRIRMNICKQNVNKNVDRYGQKWYDTWVIRFEPLRLFICANLCNKIIKGICIWHKTI